ncbi:MAG: GlxA family transcriptional regulator [Verrucomicrobia bacterium]|nr:GlxA family transcriptional regulator [Verrucomicrobiota bacterium]MBV8279396.1 GlxA family transcriptional regulator [Verrucomicrobiota bacterium]
MKRDERKIIFIVAPGVHLLDLAGPLQAFDSANGCGGHYRLHFIGSTPQVPSAVGIALTGFGPKIPADELDQNDLVIVPGVRWRGRTRRDVLSESLRDYLRIAHRSGAAIGSVCSGAFGLGEAGLLEARRCTTHWSCVKELQRRYPTAEVVDNVLFVHDRGITTSAGIASGIDLALSFIEQHYGPQMTARVARDLVVYFRRTGAHHQLSVYLDYRAHLHSGVHRVQDWLNEHPGDPAPLARLASLAAMSESTLTRAFRANTGLTPLQYQQKVRLEMAASLMRDHRLTLEVIAERCGFADVRHFRRLWTTTFGQSPSHFRRATANGDEWTRLRQAYGAAGSG